MDISENSLKNEQFDVIIMLEVLEHLQNDFHAIKEISRILKGGGILILSTPYSKGQKYSHPKTAFRLKEDLDEHKFEQLFKGGFHWRDGYDENSIESLLRKNNLEIIDTDFVCIPRTLLELERRARVFFPLTYLLSFFTFISSNKCKIVAKARKQISRPNCKD